MAELWTEAEVKKATMLSLLFKGGTRMMLPRYTPPAVCYEAAKRAICPNVEFSHLISGFPVYAADCPLAGQPHFHGIAEVSATLGGYASGSAAG